MRLRFYWKAKNHWGVMNPDGTFLPWASYALACAQRIFLLALLLQRHTRHSQHGRPVLTEERQKRVFGYIKRLVRVERDAARRADANGNRRGDPTPRSEPLTLSQIASDVEDARSQASDQVLAGVAAVRGAHRRGPD